MSTSFWLCTEAEIHLYKINMDEVHRQLQRWGETLNDESIKMNECQNHVNTMDQKVKFRIMTSSWVEVSNWHLSDSRRQSRDTTDERTDTNHDGSCERKTKFDATLHGQSRSTKITSMYILYLWRHHMSSWHLNFPPKKLIWIQIDLLRQSRERAEQNMKERTEALRHLEHSVQQLQGNYHSLYNQ